MELDSINNTTSMNFLNYNFIYNYTIVVNFFSGNSHEREKRKRERKIVEK